jgi:hypothetical protein
MKALALQDQEFPPAQPRPPLPNIASRARRGISPALLDQNLLSRPQVVQAVVAKGVQRGDQLFLVLDPAREVRSDIDFDQSCPFLEQQQLVHGPTKARRARIEVGPQFWNRDRPRHTRLAAALEWFGDPVPLVFVKFFPTGRRLERIEGLRISIGSRG